MPMIDAFIPDGALNAKAEARLFGEITEMLITLEGFDPANERAKAATWIFLHRPSVLRAGSPPASPMYRFILSVPEGQYEEHTRRAVVREVTAAVARAENKPLAEVMHRVWVFPSEVPDGTWGARGEIRTLADILAYLSGEDSGETARHKLIARRREKAIRILAGLGSSK